MELKENKINLKWMPRLIHFRTVMIKCFTITVLLEKRAMIWLTLGFDKPNMYIKISRITSKRIETKHIIKKKMEWEKNSIQKNARKKREKWH